MKRFVTLFGVLTLFSFHIFSQVGINTKNPEQIFHIDPLANNNLSVANKTSDDVVITSQGKLGIGTTVPNKELEVRGNTLFAGDMIVNDTAIVSGTASAQKLGINTSAPNATLHLANTENKTKLRISDGSESSSNLLTSDENGYVHWQALSPMTSVSAGTLASGQYIPSTNTRTSITSDSLSLTPGRWLIIAKSGVSGTSLRGFYLYMLLVAEAGFNGSTTNAPVVVGGTGSSTELAGAYAAAPNLVCVIDIHPKATTATSNETKFWISLSTSGGSGTTTNTNFGQMQFFALRIDRPS